jgi:hypothetical protein
MRNHGMLGSSIGYMIHSRQMENFRVPGSCKERAFINKRPMILNVLRGLTHAITSPYISFYEAESL